MRQSFYLCLFLLFSLVLNSVASTTGIIAGRVTDGDGNPLIGATVLIVGTPYGAMTSSEGEYVISALSAGSYTVRAQMVGRATATILGVTVESDNLSRIDFELEEDASGSTVITVTQTRTNILRDIPATAFQLDLSEMRTMTASTITDMIAEQPGVTQQDGELHVRGGRSGEIDYVLDGVSLRSPMDNRFNFVLPVSAVSDATLMTGGLSIEYGNTLSGVVDLNGKEGGDEFEGFVSGRMGDATSRMISSGEEIFSETIDSDLSRKGLSSVELSLSGPEPLTGIALPSIGINLPGEITFSASGQFSTSGADNVDTRDNWSYNWMNDGSAMIKLTYKPAPRTIFSLNTIGAYREHGWNQWAWSKYEEITIIDGKLILPGSNDYAIPTMFSETAGVILNFSHLIGENTNLKISMGSVKYQNWNRIYNPDGGFFGEGLDPVFWLSSYSPPQIYQSLQGFYFEGVHQNVWHDSKATVSSATASLDINPNPRTRLKLGVSADYYDLYQYNVYSVGPGNAYLSLWNAYPFSAAGYLQGSYRFSGGVITTAGVRADYFNANTSIFSLESSELEEVEAKLHISPRVSFSIPFNERSLFFTTYGHYFQMPPMNSLFLQTSFNMGAERVITGNPNLDPELTQLFEVGIRNELTDYSDLAISFYNKDITGLVSTEDYGEGSSYVFTNDNSHGNARGMELTLSRNGLVNLTGFISYTLSFAEGKYSSMLERYNYSQFGEIYLSKEDSYLDWDQTHQAIFDAKYSFFGSEGLQLFQKHPFENSSIAFAWRYGSGMPYSLPVQESQLIETNTERRPFTMQTDLALSKSFNFSFGEVNFMAGISNLFNRKNIVHIYDTALFHTTEDPTGEMGNPRSWSPARQFLVSAVISW